MKRRKDGILVNSRPLGKTYPVPPLSAVIPWPKPDSIYEDDGPKEEIEFNYHGHRFRVTPTSETGIHTGRTRYHVKCLTCEELIHEATTGPRPMCEQHVKED